MCHVFSPGAVDKGVGEQYNTPMGSLMGHLFSPGAVDKGAGRSSIHEWGYKWIANESLMGHEWVANGALMLC